MSLLWVTRAKYIERLKDIRTPKCKDIAERIGVITPDRIFLKNFPQKNPVTAFNPTLLVRGTVVHVYFRIILGYYKYVSAIARLDLSLEDFEQEYLSFACYPAEIVIWPHTIYDIWGAEDPRVHFIDGNYVMTYTGRTYFYFSNINIERTVPIVAITDDPYAFWNKTAFFTLPSDLRKKLVANKDTVLLDTDDKLFILHRPHLEDLPPSLWIGEVNKDEVINKEVEGVRGVFVENNRIVMLPSEFERGLGWGTPPLKVNEDEYLLIIHARGEDEVYRATAILMEYDGGSLEITGIIPYYIMEPKVMYEIVGDRPLVVFPCGAQRIGNKLLISYGAADSFIAFAYIDLNKLLSEMKSVKK
ncbi:MAG: glycosidase [Thermoprotei archaeon]|nr:MAG: glycosidase [Thermoprotei archaeon]